MENKFYFVILVGIVVSIVIAVNEYITRRRKAQYKEQQERMLPDHFDLLDNNGNPIPQQQENPVIQERTYFCIKDSGYYVSVWPKNQKIGDYIECEIAGISYRDNIWYYVGEHVGTLEAEPTNAYDSNAIKILAEDGHHVGYVPKDMTSEVRKSASLPCTCYFYIGENDGTYFSDCYIRE